MPRVLITGAAGFIGMHTAIRFLKEGWDVIGLDNINNYYSVKLKRKRVENIKKICSALEPQFELIERDLNSDIWVQLKSMDITAVIHLAAQAGVRYSLENPGAYITSNILGFQRVLEFVKETNIRQFIYASSSSIYGQTAKVPFNEEKEAGITPESYYAATKKANELMAYSYYKTFGVCSIGLRFFTVYGPWGRPDMAPYIFTNAAFERKSIKVFNHGKQMRDFTYISDIVEGIYNSFLHSVSLEGADYMNLGNGNPTNLMDFIGSIESISENSIEKVFVSSQKGDVSRTFSDNGKAKRLIGYEPTVTLESGLKLFIEWYKYYHLIK